MEEVCEYGWYGLNKPPYSFFNVNFPIPPRGGAYILTVNLLNNQRYCISPSGSRNLTQIESLRGP